MSLNNQIQELVRSCNSLNAQTMVIEEVFRKVLERLAPEIDFDILVYECKELVKEKIKDAS